jgi:hypothetical protein
MVPLLDDEVTQLRAHLERQCIVDLIYRYANRLDARDFEGVAGCFAADASLSFNGGAVTHQGVDEITAVYRIALGSGPRANGESTTHLTSNLAIELSEAGHAHGRVKVLAFLLKGSVVRVRGLQFDDEYVRTADGWRMQIRRHSVDWQSEIPAVTVTVPDFREDATP